MSLGNKLKKRIKLALKILDLIRFFIVQRNQFGKAEVVCFFPFFHMGGAEKIHLNILNSINDKNVCVLFTGKSKNMGFQKEFNSSADCFDIHHFVQHNDIVQNLFFLFLKGVLNSSSNLTSVFGCNSKQFYLLLPSIKPEVKKIDLIHAFSKPDFGIEDISIDYVGLLDTRVVINQKTYDDLKFQYRQFNKGADLLNKIRIIPNALSNPNTYGRKRKSGILKVGFLGRWAPEKRPEIFVEVARRFFDLGSKAEFYMAGTGFDERVISQFPKNLSYEGEIFDTALLNELYFNTDVLVIPSYREGMPLVVIEGMYFGVIVISTDVGSIASHIRNGYNGFIVPNTTAQAIEKQIFEKLQYLQDNEEERSIISDRAKSYAEENFRTDDFFKSYRELLLTTS